jgi:ATPase subunit of ABC transporter with duplicated ATPase domains
MSWDCDCDGAASDVADATSALALSQRQTVVVISHDRGFCEGIRCTHVAYVNNGAVTVEERALRPSDFSEADRGVANVDGEALAAAEAAVEAAVDPAEEKAFREQERRLQKQRNAAPKKLEKVQAAVEAAEAELEQLGRDMMAVGSDASAALELSKQQDEVQAKVDELYEQWEELEELIAQPAR